MTTLQMTSLGHSGVRLASSGTTVVLDPGAFCPEDSLDGADAVLITHEHFDHVVPDRLRAAAAANPELEVWTNQAVAAQFADLGGRVHTVRHGDTFDVGDIEVHVYGEKHATIHPDLPLVNNVCFLLAGQVFHPGDSLTVPDVRVPTLMAPLAAPWLKISEAIDYVRQVEPGEVYPIHAAVIAEAAYPIFQSMLNNLAGESQGRAVHTWKPGDQAKLG
jgi:L-ascorbate metabolism protein UlaG (beta-lactamase superfamily)